MRYALLLLPPYNAPGRSLGMVAFIIGKYERSLHQSANMRISFPKRALVYDTCAIVGRQLFSSNTRKSLACRAQSSRYLPIAIAHADKKQPWLFNVLLSASGLSGY